MDSYYDVIIAINFKAMTKLLIQDSLNVLSSATEHTKSNGVCYYYFYDTRWYQPEHTRFMEALHKLPDLSCSYIVVDTRSDEVDFFGDTEDFDITAYRTIAFPGKTYEH
jgi:hypothetical protein